MAEESIAQLHEPWSYQRKADDDYDLRDANGNFIGMLFDYDTARRIVTAVNATAGISIERLEELAKSGRLRQAYAYEQAQPERPELDHEPWAALGFGGNPKGVG